MNQETNTANQDNARECTLKLDGDLTASETMSYRKAIKDLIARGSSTLIIDLADCSMVDSSGIGLLVATHNSLAKSGARLALIHVSKDLRDLFQTMRLQQHFSIGE